MKQFDSNMIKIKSNCEQNNLRNLLLLTLIVFFILLCSFLVMLMVINIYNHYQYNNDLSYNHNRHQQWYHSNIANNNQDDIKINPTERDQIDQQLTTESTPLSLITTTTTTSSSAISSSPSSDLIADKYQGLRTNQGVESYVQSVLDSTFKATQELINQRKANQGIDQLNN